jgi:hypothetical protein
MGMAVGCGRKKEHHSMKSRGALKKSVKAVLKKMARISVPAGMRGGRKHHHHKSRSRHHKK